MPEPASANDIYDLMNVDGPPVSGPVVRARTGRDSRECLPPLTRTKYSALSPGWIKMIFFLIGSSVAIFLTLFREPSSPLNTSLGNPFPGPN